MQETSEDHILHIHRQQNLFFETNQTKDVNFRLTQLRKFLSTVKNYSKEIEEALWSDLHKSPEESFLTETSIVINELKNHIKNVRHWSKPQKVSTPIHLLPSRSAVNTEPLGVALIIAPWNYPFQLTMNPLIGAISSGCCAVLKPSPDAPAIAKVMEKMIAECFDPDYISMIQGGKETNTILLKQKFDLIFFTGSSKVGKVVMKAAAENLTPVILELGGKSPCIVDKNANISVAAKRIVWGKLINAGQTCIAPDYLFVHKEVENELLEKMKETIWGMYGDNPKESRFYPRIINQESFDRLKGLLEQGTIFTGGESDEQERYIEPSIITDVRHDSELMTREIFGPILPVNTFNDISEPLAYINKNEKPLAFYYFGKNKMAREILLKTSSGGACINDTIMHIANHNLPFGGVENSGMNAYHGHESFLAFSNRRAVVRTTTWIDVPFRYVPFTFFKWVKKII